jgi:4-amino-4-deoxy-L-arabinose transferase-like glycosyltransferase
VPSRRALVAIGVLALGVRLAYLLLVRPSIPLVSDGETYHLLARNIAHGRGYLAPYDWFFRHTSRPTAEFGPVHPALLAVASVFGARSILAHQVFLGIVGSVVPVLTAVVAARLTGDRVIAVGSGIVAALHPLLFGSDGALMSETTYTLLALLVVLAALSFAGDGRQRWGVVAGVGVGLAILTRGDAVLLLPFVAVPVLLGGSGVDRTFLLRLATVAGVAALVVAPWVARNAVRFDGHLVLSNNVGSLLNGSNCPATYAGPAIGSWDFRCAYRADLHGTDEAVNSAVLRSTGLRYLRAHTARLPVVMPARVGRAWGVLHPLGQARSEEADGRVFGTQAVGVVVDWLLTPLFVLGVILLHRRGRPITVLVGLVVMVTLLTALTYGSSRFREVAEPALIIGAVAGARLTISHERR